MQSRSEVSPMAKEVQPLLPQVASFFHAVLENPTCVDSVCKAKYIQLPNARNEYRTDKIIIRPCYEHMTPQILNFLSFGQEQGQIAVTGTSGIGKTVYGPVLIREMMNHKYDSVVYWEGELVYLFSRDPDVKRKFGLSDGEDPGATSKFRLSSTDGTSILSAGYWIYEGFKKVANVITDTRTTVVHDPKMTDLTVADFTSLVGRLVVILSYGHGLIDHWQTKDSPIDLELFLPLWTFDEASRVSPLLPVKPGHSCEDLFYKYGGCIRGWLERSKMEKGFVAKVEDVVKKNGDDLLKRTATSRGSIVHLHVEFDKSKPIRKLSTSPAQDRDQDKDASMGKFNTFGDSGTKYVFGSQFIIETVDKTIAEAGEDSLKRCIQTWSFQPGFESIYGGLFELRCHRAFTRIGRNPLKVKAKRVFKDDDAETETFEIDMPKFSVVRFSGNDPERLNTQDFQDSMKPGSYFWPYSSNFPSYDAIAIVNGGTVGMDNNNQPAALLVQMTVSGATNLPRLPRHEVKQRIRTKFDSVFAARVSEYQKNSAITTFVVPEECFGPFLFQKESVKKGEEAKTQPDWQLVIVMPNLFSLNNATKRRFEDEAANEYNRKHHRYSRSLD